MAAKPDIAAAVDLGSNSLHMIRARLRPQGLDILDRNKERVRLGGGLDEHERITPETSERALACLARFGEHLRGLPPGRSGWSAPKPCDGHGTARPSWRPPPSPWATRSRSSPVQKRPA